jgi:hypothetical protein
MIKNVAYRGLIWIEPTLKATLNPSSLEAVAAQKGFSSDNTFCDTSWVPPVNISAHPFGNCWWPLWLWHLFLPQLFNFILTVHVLNLPIFMARVPLPPLVIGECSPLCFATMQGATMASTEFTTTTISLMRPSFWRNLDSDSKIDVGGRRKMKKGHGVVYQRFRHPKIDCKSKADTNKNKGSEMGASKKKKEP